MKRSEGDLRKAITTLQGLSLLDQPITPILLDELGGFIPFAIIQGAFQAVLTHKNNPHVVSQWVRKCIIGAGYSAQQFIAQFSDALVQGDLDLSSIDEQLIARLFIRIAEVQYSLGEGCNELIMILNVLSVLASSSSQ